MTQILARYLSLGLSLVSGCSVSTGQEVFSLHLGARVLDLEVRDFDRDTRWWRLRANPAAVRFNCSRPKGGHQRPGEAPPIEHLSSPHRNSSSWEHGTWERCQASLLCPHPSQRQRMRTLADPTKATQDSLMGPIDQATCISGDIFAHEDG